MKKKFFSFLLGFFLLIGFPLFADTPSWQDEFHQAGEAYFARDFKKAFDLYSDLEKKGVVSGDLFYNLGNTSYRLGRGGEAIYYYTKALRIHPRDPDLVANYRYVFGRRVDHLESSISSKIFHKIFFWVDLTTLQELLGVSLLFYWAFFMLGILRFSRRRVKAGLLLIVLAGINLLLLPSAFAKFYTERLQITAVVLSPVTAVYSEPAKDSITLFNLHEGTIGTILDHLSEFSKIQLSDGKIGWVARSDLKEI